MKRNRKAKILATLGPASATPERIEALFDAGADIFRLNFSHAGHDEFRRLVAVIRAIEARKARPIGILADLQGPKLRIGTFQNGPITLTPDAPFRLDLDPAPGDGRRCCLPHPEIFAAIAPGARLLLDDGRLSLKIEACGPDFAETRVIAGGPLSDHKGVNVPNVTLPISALTAKDAADLEAALDAGADWIALSFVQRPEDVTQLRERIKGRARIMSKLEKPAAIDHLDAIVALSDAIMVARGDLGVECPPETVPILQKRMLKAARQAGRPVVVATQMLESMIRAPVPTRAEASDVATAIYDGADAVMLSAETAAGSYPVEAVTMMDRIVTTIEADPLYRTGLDAARPIPDGTLADAIGAAARQVAQTLELAAIVTFTASGATTLRTARERPPTPMLCLTTSVRVARQMALVWGATPEIVPELFTVDDMEKVALRTAKARGFAAEGQSVVITAGMPFGISGTTNILRVATLA